MSKIKDTKNKLKSRIEAIKKINDDPKKTVDNLYDKYLKDLPSTDQLFGKKLDDFLDKRKKKKENNKDIFSELVEISEGFLGVDKDVKDVSNLSTKTRIKRHAQRATKKALDSSKEIILKNVKNVFFVSDGICGVDTSINTDNITLKPSEFDILNVFTVAPNTSVGQIVYEPNKDSGKEKVNKELYGIFSGGTYQFDSLNNNTLFTMSWNVSNQEFNVSGLTQGSIFPKVESFFNDYYSTIEMPDITGITKNAMLLTIQGDGSDTQVFNKSLNDVNRLIKKLLAVCGPQTNRDDLKNQNAVNLFEENDEDIEFYFNFDDVEGIDIDDEDARLRKVLKFRDCNNFETIVNTTMMEDFIYLSNKKNLDDLVNSTLSRTATDAYNKSDSSIPELNFNLNLLNNFILNLPKALIMSLLSPKIFLPVVIMYKILKALTISTITAVKTLMKNLWKLFYGIIKDLFWIFIKEFWKLIKIDLLAFISKLVQKILRNKYKRYVVIITALIALLTKILEEGIDNCYALFTAVLSAIDTALSTKSPLNVPGILLALSDKLPGYSQDRALLNITERLESAGIPTGPLFGESNDMVSMIKSVIDGHTEEMDSNSFIKISLQGGVLPGPTGGAVIPPGLISGAGKIF